MTTPEIVNLIAAVLSIGLGVLAISLAISFFKSAKNAEGNVSNSLTKIETQTEMLQKLTGKQLDRLTKYVTEPRPAQVDDATLEILKTFKEILPHTLLSQATPTVEGQSRSYFISLLIALNFYTAQANWWAIGSLPDVDSFDSENSFHTHTKRIIDLSASDFNITVNELAKCDPKELENNPLAYLLNETKEFWGSLVKTTADALVAKAKQ